MTAEEDLELQLHVSLLLEYHSTCMSVAACAVRPDQVLHTEQHTSEAANHDEEW